MIGPRLKPALYLLCGTLLLAPALTACEEEEGPAEKLGEKVDESMEQAGDKLEEAADEVEQRTD
jgi:hypothetical protein